VKFCIKPYLIEQSLIPKRTIQFSTKYRLKINDLFGGVVKSDTQSLRATINLHCQLRE
jgi:hypothetical protein